MVDYRCWVSSFNYFYYHMRSPHKLWTNNYQLLPFLDFCFRINITERLPKIKAADIKEDLLRNLWELLSVIKSGVSSDLNSSELLSVKGKPSFTRFTYSSKDLLWEIPYLGAEDTNNFLFWGSISGGFWGSATGWPTSWK